MNLSAKPFQLDNQIPRWVGFIDTATLKNSRAIARIGQIILNGRSQPYCLKSLTRKKHVSTSDTVYTMSNKLRQYTIEKPKVATTANNVVLSLWNCHLFILLEFSLQHQRFSLQFFFVTLFAVDDLLWKPRTLSSTSNQGKHSSFFRTQFPRISCKKSFVFCEKNTLCYAKIIFCESIRNETLQGYDSLLNIEQKNTRSLHIQIVVF